MSKHGLLQPLTPSPPSPRPPPTPPRSYVASVRPHPISSWSASFLFRLDQCLGSKVGKGSVGLSNTRLFHRRSGNVIEHSRLHVFMCSREGEKLLEYHGVTVSFILMSKCTHARRHTSAHARTETCCLVPVAFSCLQLNTSISPVS